jgi:peroxiredoxin
MISTIIKQSFAAIGLLLTLTAAQAEGLTNFSGQPQQLQQYIGKGQWTVVMMWASDCLVCNKEAHQYVAFHEQHKDNDARVLGITLDGLDNVEAARAFVQEHQVTFPSLIGKPEDVAQLYTELTGYRWVGTPTFLVFAPTGKLLAHQVGAIPTSMIEDFINSQGSSEP